MNAHEEIPTRGIEFLEAWRAMRALLADKEDTAQVFRIMRALDGNQPRRNFERFAATPVGAAVLAEPRSLFDRLCDTAWLASLPAGSLGRAYLDFCTRENISAQGLADASANDEPPTWGPNAQRYGLRMRDMHDLWHVTTGYGRDGLGELALLAFSYAQTKLRGFGFIVLMAIAKIKREHPSMPVIACVREAHRLGRAAEWLAAADWEHLLTRPLEEVRATLKIGRPARYLAIARETQARDAELRAQRAQTKAAA